MAEQGSSQRGARRGGGRTRAANWTPQELRVLFRACAQRPRLALGLTGTDSGARRRRHAFFAEIATSVSALGVAPRDWMATQRRFVEALKAPRDAATRLMRGGTPLAEALEQGLRGTAHIDLLRPILQISVEAAPSGLDSLAPVAAAMRQHRAAAAAAATASSDPADDPVHADVPPDPAPSHGSPPLPDAAFTAQGQSAAAPVPGVHLQDAAVSDALDDLSLASTGDGGEGSEQGSQALPPVVAMEQDEGAVRSHGTAAAAAPVHPPPAPATHDDGDSNMPVPAAAAPVRRADDDDGDAEGGDGEGDDGDAVGGDGEGDDGDAAGGDGEGDDGDDDAVPVRPHARGPRAAAPLPRDVAGLWAQVQRSLSGAHHSTNENWTSFKEAFVSEATTLQGIGNDVVASVRQLNRAVNASTVAQVAALRDVAAAVRDLTALHRELGTPAPRGGARGRGRPRGTGGPGAAPAGRSRQHHVQEASSVSEGEATAEEVAVPLMRGRPQRRIRPPERSLSSPPHAAKRGRRR